jgi:hypothetical protein
MEDREYFISHNVYNHETIGVLSLKKRIGFINHCQTGLFQYWIQSNCHIQASIQRLNGTKENPRIFAFVAVTPPKNSVA